MIKLNSDIAQTVAYPPGGNALVDRVVFNGTRVYEKTPGPYGLNQINCNYTTSPVQRHSFIYNINVENDFIIDKHELYVNEGTGDGTGGDLIGLVYQYSQGYDLQGASAWNFSSIDSGTGTVLPAAGTAYRYFLIKSTGHSGEYSWSTPVGAYTAFMGKPTITSGTQHWPEWTRITYVPPANNQSTYVDYSTDGTNWNGLWIRGAADTDAWHNWTAGSSPIYYRIRFRDTTNLYSLYSDPIYIS